MAQEARPHYDFNHDVFKARRQYLLYAKDHMELWDLKQQSDVIDWTVKSTVSVLEIPTTYHVTYKLRSIIGIDQEAQPIYGESHLLELTIPTRYPLEPASIFMLSDTWHPNIQSEGRFKGKICGNVDDYGVDYSLRQLVLRVGEILQYKNYLADFIPPYPEDPKVAQWVKAYAEPRNIVNRKDGICTDNQALVRPGQDESAAKIRIGGPANPAPNPVEDTPAEPTAPTPPPPEDKAEDTADTSGGKIKVSRREDGEAPPRRKIVIGRKRADKENE